METVTDWGEGGRETGGDWCGGGGFLEVNAKQLETVGDSKRDWGILYGNSKRLLERLEKLVGCMETELAIDCRRQYNYKETGETERLGGNHGGVGNR